MWKRVALASGLFLLSPLIGEFLLGNLPITMLPALIALAPLYGGGALLIRELARRRGAGWPGIVLLSLAYGLLEEGLVTQSLFNPGYAGLDLLSYGWIPELGLGAWWTVFVLAVHAMGSICLPIAVMESLVPGRAHEPWLGRPGLVVAFVLFVLGVAATMLFNATPYLPSPAQLAGTVIVAGLLVAAALLRRPPAAGTVTPDGARAPGPWPMLAFALAAGTMFWLAALLLPVEHVPAWLTVTGYLACYAAFCGLTLRWSRRPGWGQRQVFGLAAGGVLGYAWHGFPQPPAVPAEASADLAGNTVFALAAVALLAVTALRLRSRAPVGG